MGYSVLLFLMILFTTVFSIYDLVNSIRELRRLGGLNGHTRFIIAGILCIIFICCNPPHWNSALDLNDSQIATGVLKYQNGNFILTGSGDDSQEWDFSHCEIDSMLKLHCKDKEITVWHNDHVVYQVEKNGKIIYRIGNSNRRIILDNLDHIMLYILVCTVILRVVTNYDFRLKYLLEEEQRKEFEDRFITEEEVKPSSKIATTSYVHFTDQNDTSKMVRRFCKNCGTELGEILETRNSHGLTGFIYNQYKFCPNCGLDSDPSMPSKEHDKSFIYWLLILFFLIMVVFLAQVVAIKTLFVILSFVAIIAMIVFVKVRSAVRIKCPRCGNLHCEEHFCPNCGTELNKNE